MHAICRSRSGQHSRLGVGALVLCLTPGVVCILALLTPVVKDLWPQHTQVVVFDRSEPTATYDHESPLGDLGLRWLVAALAALLAVPAALIATRYSRPRRLVLLVAFVNYGSVVLLLGGTLLFLLLRS